MRIVHTVYSLAMGGAEVIVAQLARLHRSQGHDVRVVCYSHLGMIGEQLVAEGFDVRVLGEAHPLVTMARYFAFFRELDPDVVHCHNVAATIQAAIPARVAGVRCVLSTRHSVGQHPYDRAGEAKFNLAARACHWVAGICQITCDRLAVGPFAPTERIVRVYNGSAAVPRTNFDALRADDPDAGFTLVFVGRLVWEKDLGTLLEAVAIARESVAGLRCWIVGDGPKRAEMEAKAEELALAGTVRFWGMRTDTPAFFSAADVFVMSSISEGLPMSLLQSMSLGTPCILTDVEGMGEVLRLTESGLLTPAGDAAAFAQAIVRLATDRPLYEELSARAHQAYAERFTLERMGENYLRLYRLEQPE